MQNPYLMVAKIKVTLIQDRAEVVDGELLGDALLTIIKLVLESDKDNHGFMSLFISNNHIKTYSKSSNVKNIIILF